MTQDLLTIPAIPALLRRTEALQKLTLNPFLVFQLLPSCALCGYQKKIVLQYVV